MWVEDAAEVRNASVAKSERRVCCRESAAKILLLEECTLWSVLMERRWRKRDAKRSVSRKGDAAKIFESFFFL